MSDFDPTTWRPLRKGLTFGLMGLAVVSYVVSLFGTSDPDAPTLPVILSILAFFYLGGVFLARGSDGDEYGGSGDADDVDRQIAKLQKQLRRAAEGLAIAEAQGNQNQIIFFRGDIVQLESQLRRLGA